MRVCVCLYVNLWACKHACVSVRMCGCIPACLTKNICARCQSHRRDTALPPQPESDGSPPRNHEAYFPLVTPTASQIWEEHVEGLAGVFVCDLDCGFTGSHATVAAHERTCPNRAPGDSDRGRGVGERGSAGQSRRQTDHIPTAESFVMGAPAPPLSPQSERFEFGPVSVASPPSHPQQPHVHDLRLQTMVRAHTSEGGLVGGGAAGVERGRGAAEEQGRGAVRRVLITNFQHLPNPQAAPQLHPAPHAPIEPAFIENAPTNAHPVLRVVEHRNTPVAVAPNPFVASPHHGPHVPATHMESPMAPPMVFLPSPRHLPPAASASPAHHSPAHTAKQEMPGGRAEGRGLAGRTGKGGSIHLSGPDGNDTHHIVVTHGSVGGRETLIIQAHNLVLSESFWREIRGQDLLDLIPPPLREDIAGIPDLEYVLLMGLRVEANERVRERESKARPGEVFFAEVHDVSASRCTRTRTRTRTLIRTRTRSHTHT